MAPFFLDTHNGMDYQVAFFMQIGEFARECAKGHNATTAWAKAERVAAKFSPTVQEKQFADLMAIFQDGRRGFVTVSFWLNGQYQTAKVWFDGKPVAA